MGLGSHLINGTPPLTADPGAGVQLPSVVTVGPAKSTGRYVLELNAVSFQVPVVPPVPEKLQYCGNFMYTN